MRCGHELGDERATRRGARKRIRLDAVPTGMVILAVSGPDLFFDVRTRVLDDTCATQLEVSGLHRRKVAASGSRSAAGSPAEAKVERTLLRSVKRKLQLGLRIRAEAV